MEKNNQIIIPAKLDETCTVIAQLHHVSGRYVHKIVKEGYMPKGKKAKQRAESILKLFVEYKSGKNKLVHNLSQKVA